MKFNKNRILPILSVGLVMTSCAGPDESDNADIKSDLKESVRYDDMLSKEMTAFAALPASRKNNITEIR